MWYWVALDQVRMTKPQGRIRIFTLASHRSKGNNIFISLSHTVGCQAVLRFRTFGERIDCRGNGASVGDVPQWRMNKIDCRHQGACQTAPMLQLWMCRDEEEDEKFPLFPDAFSAAWPMIQQQQLSMKSCLQENQERMAMSCLSFGSITALGCPKMYQTNHFFLASPEAFTSIALLNGIDAAAVCLFLQHLKKIKRFLRRRQAKGTPLMENKFSSPP